MKSKYLWAMRCVSVLRGWLAPLRPRRSVSRRPTLRVEELEPRMVPTGTIPIYLNAPTSVVSQGVYVAITGKDPAATPVDQGEYVQLGTQTSGGVYPGTYTDLSAATTTIPLQKLAFQSSSPPAGDPNVPSGDSWVQVNLPNSLVDSGQILMFFGKNSPTTLPVVSSSSGGSTFYNVSAPSPTTYPNNTFGLFEYSVSPGSTPGSTTSYIDISNVDSIGQPFTVQTNPVSTAPTNQGVGIQLSFTGVQNQYQVFLTNLASSSPGAADFQELVTPTMIVAPQHVIDATSTTGPKLGLGSTSGGYLAPSTLYYYEITAVVNGVESTAGPSTSLGTGTAVSNDLSLLLGWAPVANATSYNIYRSTDGTHFGLLSSVQAPITAFLDDGSYVPTNQSPPPNPPAAPTFVPTLTPEYVAGGALPANTTYYYELTATTASGESLPNNYVANVVGYGQNAIQVSWSGTYTGATGYNIYRATSPSGPFTLLTNVPATTTLYTDDTGAQPPQNPPNDSLPAPTASLISGGSLSVSSTYYYEYTVINNAGIESLPSSASTGQTPNSGNQTITVSWPAVTGAAQYILYRSTSSSGPFDFLANVGAIANPGYGDSGSIAPTSAKPPSTPPTAPVSGPTLTPATGGSLATGTYYYELTALTSSGQTLASPSTSLALPAGDNTINLSWGTFNGATGYKIYRSSTGVSGSFLLLTTLGGAATTYTDTGVLHPGGNPPTALLTGPAITDPALIPVGASTDPHLANGTYYYEITATSASGETTASNSIQITITNTSTSWFAAYLSWPKFLGATGYNIYRSTTGTAGSYTLYASTTTNFYTDFGQGTSTATTPPTNSYTYNPLSSYFTQNLVTFFENYTAANNSFALARDGYNYTGQTTTITDTGSDGQSHTYVVFKLTGTYNGTPPTGWSPSVTLYLYAPFFTSNYAGTNPFAGSSVSFLNNYVVPPSPQWMTDGTQMPGSMVFGGSGVFNTGLDDPKAVIQIASNGASINLLSDVENSIDAAFNRGIAVASSGGQAALPANNWADLPVALSATATTGGSLSSTGNYYYLITTIDSLGQSPASNEVAAVMANGDNAVTVDWQAPSASDAPIAPTGYNVYRAASQNGPWTLVNSTPITNSTAGGLYTYTDLGGGTPSTPPQFYPAGSNSNYYADFLHQSSTLLPGNPNNGTSINGLAYGFAYDDQGGQSTTIVINNLQSLQVNFQPLGTSLYSTTGNLYQGNVLTLNGSGFDLIPSENQVTLSSGSGFVSGVNSNGTQLYFTFTTAPVPGPLTASVTTDDGGDSGAPLQVANVLADTTPPSVNLAATPAVNTASTSATFQYIGSDNATPRSQLHYEVSLDGSTFQPVSGTTRTYTGLGLGSHTFQVEAIDLAGNISAPTSYTWTITTPTQIVIVSGANQSTAAGSAFTQPITLEVLDKNGNPVADVGIFFSTPLGTGPSASLAAVTTGNTGAALVPATADNFVGSYGVTAITGAVSSTPFTLTNLSPLGTNPNAIFVENVYALLLDRAADPGAAGWVNLLNQGVAPTSVVQDIESSREYLNDVVTGLYQQYLNRAPDPGAQGWVNLLQAGASIEQVTADIAGSTEFFQDAGGTNVGFLTALYKDVLERAPDTAGEAAWLQALANGTSRTQAALGFLTSQEYRTDLLNGNNCRPADPSGCGYYPMFLRRPADPGGLADFLGQLNAGVSDQVVLAAILGSPEGYGKWS